MGTIRLRRTVLRVVVFGGERENIRGNALITPPVGGLAV